MVVDSINSIYAVLPVVMALMWFRTPLAEIAWAVQLTEPQLEDFFGPAIFKFVHEFYGGPQPKSSQEIRMSDSARMDFARTANRDLWGAIEADLRPLNRSEQSLGNMA